MQGDVALNLYDFVVRRPGKPTEKYGLRAYDEIILAPMVGSPAWRTTASLIAVDIAVSVRASRDRVRPEAGGHAALRIARRERRDPGAGGGSLREFQAAHDGASVIDVTVAQTQAMIISTQHLLPSALPTPTVLQEVPPVAQATGANTPVASEPQPDASRETAGGAIAGASGPRYSLLTVTEPCIADHCLGPPEDAMDVTPADNSEQAKEEPKEPNAEQGPAQVAAEAPVEVIDVDQVEIDVKPPLPVPPAPVPAVAAAQQHAMSPSTYPGGYTIDVCFEASKLPLDVAIFNSARAAGGDEKIRKYLQNVLVVGGCALIPGMPHALESR